MRVVHHRPGSPGTKRPNSPSERGLAIVEMSFVAILLLTIIAGTFDFGLAWRSGMVVTEAVRTGARVGSGQSISRGADYYALSGMQASLTSAGKIDDVVQVVIYKANTAGATVPASCTSASPSGTCNVLTGAQFKALTLSSFTLVIDPDPGVQPTGSGCLKGSAALLSNWCPSARVNFPQDSSDYYGVWVKYRHRNLFPISGASRDITRYAVMRIEPEVS